MVFRRLSRSLRATTLAAAGLLCAGAASAATPMTLADYLALGGPAPSAHIAYGPAPSQYAELFLPNGDGPFPVVVLVHGGCWTVQFGGIKQMHNVAGALAAAGIAVWNVEYRRVEEGGGYPGMYLDMEAAIASLASEAPHYHLDTRRIVAVGHSAGGQLVQWIAGRARLPPASPLYQRDFLPIGQIVSLGGLADLRHEKDLIRHSCDRDVADLTGQPGPGRTDVYADTDAARLMPNGSTTVLINGQFDRVSPPQTAAAYAALAHQAGDRADTLVLPNASHYDEVAASSPSWQLILPVIRQALGMPPAAEPNDPNPPSNPRRQE